jgi:transcriptional regulator
MYLPKQFEQSDRALALELMRAHNFATLVSVGDDGAPFITHLPLIATEESGELIVEGHVARPNPHAKMIERGVMLTAAFMGPHAYMSPAVYSDLARVPTWNYLTVHASGAAQVIEGEAAKDALLKKLIAIHEPGYAQQWRDLGEEFQRKMLAGITAFRFTVTKLETKFKLNQHRKEAHVAMHARYAQGSADEQALAAWMQRLGMV